MENANYFDLFGLQPAYGLDAALLRRRYYEKSRALHPDLTEAGDSDSDLQAAVLNRAYQTLSQPLLRLRYLIDTEFPGIANDVAEEDPAFLLELMELHEGIQEGNIENEEAQKRLETMEREALAAVEGALLAFDEGRRLPELADALRNFYHRSKYFLRVRQLLEGKHPEW
ncbi:MAG: hypothetical protein KBF37_08575 [Saprospiraceae bacterium]|jgi:molecular chaperone HscB|nr:hypothetical protein [Saprospiraceae bacterium]MBP9210359.1 hypothetical protein [Saprospiraceae bacterium]MBV6473945.1 Co-chaperone protein HscB [Saprospiraceae bacterium]